MATARWNIRPLAADATAPARSRRAAVSRVVGGLAALVLLGSSGAGAAQDAASANGLIHRLYANVGHIDQRRPYPLWWQFLSARTKAQHLRLRALDAKAGSASIDYDWLCQCQDVEGIRVTSVKLSNTSPAHATAIVRFVNGSDWQGLRLLLVYEGGWKIDDMVNDRGRHFTDDLRAGLQGYGQR